MTALLPPLSSLVLSLVTFLLPLPSFFFALFNIFCSWLLIPLFVLVTLLPYLNWHSWLSLILDCHISPMFVCGLLSFFAFCLILLSLKVSNLKKRWETTNHIQHRLNYHQIPSLFSVLMRLIFSKTKLKGLDALCTEEWEQTWDFHLLLCERRNMNLLTMSGMMMF